MHLHLVTLHVQRSPQSVPLAAAFLQASIAAHFSPPATIKVTKSDYPGGTPIQTMADAIAVSRPEIVGFSLYTWNRAEVSRLVHLFRERFPQMLLLGGGPEATADPEGIMAEAPFDLLIIGEGEGALCDLLRRRIEGLPLNDLPGIVLRHAGKIVRSSPSSPLALINLPSPWLSGLLDAYIPQGVLWQLTRGCSFACDFCFDGMGSQTVRRFPLDRIAAELDYLVRHGVRQIFVLDSTFNQDRKRAKEILKMIKKRAPRVHFHFEIRYEFLDAESVQLFAAIPSSLQIGLQSASPRVLGEVGRTFNPALFRDKIALLNHSGATFGFDLIYGLPGDSLGEFKKSLDFALEQYPNQLDIFPLAILPGTRLAGKVKELHLLHLTIPPYTILSSPTFPAEDLAAAQRLAYACDIFYSRGKAVAWFNCIRTALKLSPAALLLAFADWISAALGHDPEPADYHDEKIWLLQRSFLGDLFARHLLTKLLPMALDLVDYHYFLASILQSPPPRIPRARELAKIDILRTPLSRSPASRLAYFSHDISKLINLGEPQLAAAVSQLKAVGSSVVLYSCQGEVCAESLPEEYFRLLKELDGYKKPENILSSLGISREDGGRFLTIALREGILEANKN